MADAVADFIRKRNLGPVTLVGGAMGSAIAQFVVLEHPDLVQRLVLTAVASKLTTSAPPPASAGAVPPRQTREQAKAEWEAMSPAEVQKRVDSFFASDHSPAAYAQQFYEALRQTKFEAQYDANQSNMSGWSTYERLGEIEVPALIIQGKLDRMKTPEEGQRMVSRMPNAKLVVLENSSHTPWWDEPQAFEAVALPFIREGTPRPARRKQSFGKPARRAPTTPRRTGTSIAPALLRASNEMTFVWRDEGRDESRPYVKDGPVSKEDDFGTHSMTGCWLA